MRRCKSLCRAAVFAIVLSVPRVRADEGMWPFDNLPVQQLKDRYGFEPTPEWITGVRSAAVRFNSGGSGSFVSRDGLIMTNHHVAADTLQKLSSPTKDYLKDGFLDSTRAQEVRAPDLELNVLVEIKDVTDRIGAAAATTKDEAAAGRARREAIAKIEKESLDQTGLRSDVVTLYRGGRYHLYLYKKYTDVRLVFAPESAIASFGGDPDNFEYPRYDLDVAFFRAYENGAPARPAHHYSWGSGGVKDGDLVFVVGNPGSTSRLNTVRHLEFLRDTSLPQSLASIEDREAFLLEYGLRGTEQRRQAEQDLHQLQNSKKALAGRLSGLRDPALIARKNEQERAVRERIAADPKRRESTGRAWDKIGRSLETARRISQRVLFLETGAAFNSQLFDKARTIVRLVEEDQKPNTERLREFGAARRASLERALYSPAPIYPQYEEAKLARSLTYWRRSVGDTDPTVTQVLAGRSPLEAAAALVQGSRLADVAARKSLVAGGKNAVTGSDDAMIQLALAVDGEARSVRKTQESDVEDVQTAQYGLLAQALFELDGTAVYPDATFTLRLAFGLVKGYEADGAAVTPFTTIGGAFDHAATHGNNEPYRLPSSWMEARAAGRLALETPLDFVTTADTIGGNSGSPIVDRSGAVIGLNFDRNRYGLSRDFFYDDRQGRNIVVDVRAINEALRSVYHANALIAELHGG
jgi:hypothetical protein